MPPTRKPENRGLPARWQLHHGAYFYRVPPGLEHKWDGKKKFRLGATLTEAYKTWAERLGAIEKAATIGQLLDRYALEDVPNKAPATRKQYLTCIGRLRKQFADWPLDAIKPRHIYAYVDARTKAVTKPDGTVASAKTQVIARREIQVLSHAFTKAVEWGYIDRHPFKSEVRLENPRPRDRYIEDWEMQECLALEPKRARGGIRVVQAYIRLKWLTGMRRGDLLRLQPARDFLEDGIHVQPNKTANTTGKRTIYAWTDELRAVVAEALAARPVDISPWLFCNRMGKCYLNEETGRAPGFESVWWEFMNRVMAETKVKDRFHEHDIRAKTASDAENVEHARGLLSHSDTRMTTRVYRRKAEVVEPLKISSQ